MFIKDMRKLKRFRMDNTHIMVVECEEWVLRGGEVNLGDINNYVKLLKQERQRYAIENNPNAKLQKANP
jgi:hypothetical protein